jgi:hypothetical protein
MKILFVCCYVNNSHFIDITKQLLDKNLVNYLLKKDMVLLKPVKLCGNVCVIAEIPLLYWVQN